MSRQSKSVMDAPKTRDMRSAAGRITRERIAKPELPGKATPIPKPWERVRQDKLQRAKRLLQNAQYPSDEVVESVAKLLARHWRRLHKASGPFPG